MIERLEVTARRAGNGTPAGSDISVGPAVDPGRKGVVRHRRRIAGHPAVGAVLTVGRQCVEILDLMSVLKL